MKITRKNYEPFFLDYLEGNLDEHFVNEFIDFLQQNPDLKEELELFEPVALPDEPVVFENKSRLLRPDFDDRAVFETTAIALLEGDLTDAEQQHFQQYLSENPQKQKEAKRFEKTRLQPDKAIVFTHKSRLRKSSGAGLFLAWSMSAAAVLLIALALWNFWPAGSPSEISQPVVAENPEPETTITTEPQPRNVPQPVETAEITVEKTAKKQPVTPKKTVIENRAVQEDEIKMPAAAERIEPVRLSHIASIEIDNLPVEERKTGLTFASVPPNFNPEYYDENDSSNKINMQFEYLSLEKIARSGMELITGITKNDKISYEKDDKGRVTHISVNTRLFDLSAPVKRK